MLLCLIIFEFVPRFEQVCPPAGEDLPLTDNPLPGPHPQSALPQTDPAEKQGTEQPTAFWESRSPQCCFPVPIEVESEEQSARVDHNAGCEQRDGTTKKKQKMVSSY